MWFELIVIAVALSIAIYGSVMFYYGRWFERQQKMKDSNTDGY